MEILYFFEGIRNLVLDRIMLFITHLGEETVFLVAALIVFWCIDKYKGYYLLTVGFLGTIVSQFMKLAFRIPRPWVLDEKFTIVEEARAQATGYSFPSGHSQNAVGTFGTISVSVKQEWIRCIAVAIAILVPVSRMYLGVHTLQDVIVGSALALLLILALKPVFTERGKRFFPFLLIGLTLMAFAYLSYVEFYQFPTDIDANNLASGKQNAYTLLGCLIGFVIVYIVDEKWLQFQTKAVWWIQCVKIVLGLVLVLLVKGGLKTPLNLLFGELSGRMIRYCLVVIFAGIVWPLTFKCFAKIEKKG